MSTGVHVQAWLTVPSMLGTIQRNATSARTSMSKHRRLKVIALADLGLLVAALAHVYFYRIRPIGSGPAGPQVSASVFENTWSDRPILLIGLGDSVTAGFGARRGYSYFDLLITNSPTEHPDMLGKCLGAVLPHLTFTNLSQSGSTSGEHADRQLRRLPTVESNHTVIVVMTTGGNDLIHNYGRTPPREEAMYGARWDEAQLWISNFDQRLEAMVLEILRKYPSRCHIFLANVYDPTDGFGDIHRAGLPPWPDGLRILAAYNDVIFKCAERHAAVHLVDIHKAFLGHGIHCTQFWSDHYQSSDPHYWYYVNLEDPNERGYDAIRRLMLIEIAQVAEQLR
jgi:lysophospholipase L1-like esterase